MTVPTDISQSGENERNQPAAMPMESSNPHNKTPPRDSYWFAQGGVENIPPKNAQNSSKSPQNPADSKEAQLQKDKEERIRVFREQQEEERLKKLKDLEQQFLQAKKHREQQEEERKRRIEEARIRETERRQQVEERKRQIWEAEQERKEAILRRNMEREARIEARRNAQRNSLCFAFGSSTPRTFDLDLAAIGVGKNTSPGSVLMSSVSGRRSEERELGPPRATSACSLDRKFEILSHDDYSNDQRDLSRSMSLEPSPGRFSNLSKQIALQHKSSNDMKACLTMWDNSLSSCPNNFDSQSSGWLVGSGVLVGEDCMSRSMVSLSSSAFRGRKRTDILPTLTRERSITPHVTPRGKDTSRSPSRPQSSMSGASEISATSSSISAVNMRTRSAPRRPRPYSIAGSVVDRTPLVISVKKEPENQRQPRLQEKIAQPNVSKFQRANSASREKSDIETPKPLSAPKKPVPPPKSKEVLARAKSHPVPTKDNLRKNVRPNVTNVAKANVEKQHEEKEKSSDEKESVQNKDIKSPVESKSDNVFEIVNSSPITSPVTDSEMCISFEDSRAITESDGNTYTQTYTESENKVDQSESVSASKEKIDEDQKIESPKENIPIKSEHKVTSVNNSNQETIQQSTVETENPVVVPQKPRITSEEEARAALAEKRRLAREQAEREAELERQRQEELRRQEEERKRIEEEKQREMELEQIRLAELHRQLEEEKLRKAIEERQQREKEEQEKREEEARQKAEKEEQERKAREEAEKQRLELEERLRKEEEERAERKRRVEQIMARTRGRSAQTPPATTPSDTTNKIVKTEESNQSSNSADNSKTNIFPAQDSTKAKHVLNGSAITKLENNSSLSTSVTNNSVSSANPYQILEDKMSSSAPLPDLLNTNFTANHSVKSNGHHVENDEHFSPNISVSNSFNLASSRTLSANEVTSPTQTNGYSSHDDMSCTTSPEETSDAGLLIDIGSSQQNDAKITIQPADFTKLVDIEPSSLNINNENYLINVDNVNSNILSPEKSFSGFDDRLQKKSDAQVADLLS